jgi:uroporphyrinogen decarboxylase
MDRLDMDASGCSPNFQKTDEAADGTFRDEWGVIYRMGTETLAHPLKGPIETMEDAKAYRTPDPWAAHRLGKLPELIKRYKGKRAIFFHHRAAFMWSVYLMGFENILMSLLTKPELAELVMDKVLQCNMEIARNAIQAGAEVILLGDDFAHNQGPFMSPEIFEQFILPRMKKMIDMIHEGGALCVKHSDGNLYALLDMIVSAGPDGLHSIEPTAGMELGKVKELVGHKLCLLGNIDCAEVLPHGSEAEVREAVRVAIADAGEGGGFILASSNSIHSSCRPGNFLAMVKACKEFGTYG